MTITIIKIKTITTWYNNNNLTWAPCNYPFMLTWSEFSAKMEETPEREIDFVNKYIYVVVMVSSLVLYL
jgi:hypothetical protein